MGLSREHEVSTCKDHRLNSKDVPSPITIILVLSVMAGMLVEVATG